MAVIIPMPTNVPEAVSAGCQRQNEISRMMMSGHLRIGFSNMDNTGAPKVLAYSVFEMDDVLYRTLADEAVGGSVSAGYNYVYAVPNDGGAAFRYSAAKPSWDVMKAGWYNGANRAVLRFFYTAGEYAAKLVTDIYNYAIADMGGLQTPPDNAPRTLVFNRTAQGEGSVTLGPGVYEVRMRGGKGGNGGSNGGAGGTGGGGGGGGGIGSPGAGGVLLSTTHGYVRIYRTQ